jgi:glucokinase
VERAKAGDPLAQEVVDTTGALIGKALSYVTNLLNLQKIVLGGGVMQSFDQFYPSMERSFQANLFRNANPSVQIEQSALGYHVALMGAASLTLLHS